jgi:hypothetical protein
MWKIQKPFVLARRGEHVAIPTV